MCRFFVYFLLLLLVSSQTKRKNCAKVWLFERVWCVRGGGMFYVVQWRSQKVYSKTLWLIAKLVRALARPYPNSSLQRSMFHVSALQIFRGSSRLRTATSSSWVCWIVVRLSPIVDLCANFLLIRSWSVGAWPHVRQTSPHPQALTCHSAAWCSGSAILSL